MRHTQLLLSIPLALCLALPACTTTPRPDSATAQAAPAPIPLHQQIDTLLREITAAVSTANQPRYLACVSLDDPCFATEQRNWAKDLARAKPATFELRLANPETELAPAPDGSVITDLTFTWQMPDHKERSLTLPARFVNTPKGYRYAGESWKTLEAPGVRVYFSDGAEAAAKVIADVLPAVREHVHEVFSLQDDANLTGRTQQVKLYRSMAHLQQSIYLSYTDALAGWNEPGESIKILSGRSAGKTMMRTLLGHEYGHVCTFELGPKANDMPWWILEGIAEYSAQKYAHDAESVDRTVRSWSEHNKLVAWDDLADFHGEALKHQEQVYIQGHHMIIFITDRFGDQKRTAWLRAMSNGATLDDATKSELGLPFAELDAKWRDNLKAPREPVSHDSE